MNPFPEESSEKEKVCGTCDGKGWIPIQTSPDDFTMEDCPKCQPLKNLGEE